MQMLPAHRRLRASSNPPPLERLDRVLRLYRNPSAILGSSPRQPGRPIPPVQQSGGTSNAVHRGELDRIKPELQVAEFPLGQVPPVASPLHVLDYTIGGYNPSLDSSGSRAASSLLIASTISS